MRASTPKNWRVRYWLRCAICMSVPRSVKTLGNRSIVQSLLNGNETKGNKKEQEGKKMRCLLFNAAHFNISSTVIDSAARGAASTPLLHLPRAGKQQRVGPLHEARRIFERTAFGQQRLVEQQMRPIVEVRAISVQGLHERML